MNVGVRELKQHLSEYLRRVADGEVIQVTDRGVPVALITPARRPDPLARGVEEGWIRPPVSSRPLGAGVRSPAERRTLDVLREDRGE
jgi:prevent-host-death family protein